MSLTVVLPSDLERLLEDEAKRTGLSPASVAQEVLRKSLTQRPAVGMSAPRLPADESPLLEEINRGPSTAEMERYLSLIARRQDEGLGADELEALRSCTARMEQLAASRMQALVALAVLRGVSVEALMDELAIHPPDVL